MDSTPNFEFQMKLFVFHFRANAFGKDMSSYLLPTKKKKISYE